MTTAERIELLETPIWSLKQLMDYLRIKSRATGIKLKNRAFNEQNGRVPYGNQYVKRDAVLALLGVSYEEELIKLKRSDYGNNSI